MAYQLAVALYNWTQSSAADVEREKAAAVRLNFLSFPLPWLNPPQNARVEDAKPRPVGHGKSQVKLAYGSVSDEAVFHLLRMLETSATVESLDLQFNEITDVGASDIAAGLRANASITDLNLAHNYISDVGFASLSTALAANRSLLTLSLASNVGTSYGAVALLCSLQLNRTLRRLVLADLHLGPDVATQLSAALRANPDSLLDSVELQRNNLGEEGGKAFANFLAYAADKTRLTKLNLAYNGFGDGAGLAFANALGAATRVESIDLYGNPFTDRVAFALVSSIPLTSKLSFLSVGGAAFGADGQAVLRAFEAFHNKRLAAASAIDPSISSSASILIHVHDASLSLPGRAPRCPIGHLLLPSFAAVSLITKEKFSRLRCGECEVLLRLPSSSVFFCSICIFGLCGECARRTARALQMEQQAREVFWERYKYAGITP